MTDDELLAALEVALVAEPSEPSAASLLTLRRAVNQPSPVRRSWPRRLSIPALAGVMTVAGASVAFAASGAPLPEPVRAIVHGAGLPVDSPSLASARAARAALRQALLRGDTGAIDQSAQRFRGTLTELTDGERGRVADADELLGRADNETTGGAQSPTADHSTTEPSDPSGGAPSDPSGGAPSGGGHSPSESQHRDQDTSHSSAPDAPGTTTTTSVGQTSNTPSDSAPAEPAASTGLSQPDGSG